jgi:AT hook motif
MSTPTPATIEITAFLDSQLSSFRSFLQSCDELTTDELKKEIALHNTRMLKVVSDFNKQNQNQNQNLTPPFLTIPSGRGEWDDMTGGEEMRENNSFQSHAQGYNHEGGRNLFASYHPGIFNRRKTKTKGYVKAGAATLFKTVGSGGNFERRIFGYGFDDDSSEGSVAEEEVVTPSKSRRGGKRDSGRHKEGKRDEKEKKNGEGKGEVVLLDSSESEGEVKDNRIIEVDANATKEARRVLSGLLSREAGNEAVVINEGNSAHQQRMNWILEMTGRKRKGEGKGEDVEMEPKRGRGRPRKNIEMEIGGVATADIKRGRGRPRKVEILE